MKKFIALCLASLMLGACGGDNTTNNQPTDSPTTATYAKNPAWETIIVGTQGDYPPFAFKNEHGTLIGFEKELLEAIATASHFNVEFIDAKRNDMTLQLNSNVASIWASSISINAERQAEMELSKPYLDYVRSVIILDNETNKDIKTLAQLQGKTIAYSSVGSSDKSRVIEINKNELLALSEPSAFLAIKAVYTGKAVGAMGNSMIFNYYTMQYPTIPVRLIPTSNERTDLVFAMKKGNIALRDKVNAGLAKVKADGTYDKLIQKWFGKIS